MFIFSPYRSLVKWAREVPSSPVLSQSTSSHWRFQVQTCVSNTLESQDHLMLRSLLITLAFASSQLSEFKCLNLSVCECVFFIAWMSENDCVLTCSYLYCWYYLLFGYCLLYVFQLQNTRVVKSCPPCTFDVFWDRSIILIIINIPFSFVL